MKLIEELRRGPNIILNADYHLIQISSQAQPYEQVAVYGYFDPYTEHCSTTLRTVSSMLAQSRTHIEKPQNNFFLLCVVM